MRPRSRKYFFRTKDDGSKKGSVTKAGYNEQNELTSHGVKENPAPSEAEDKKQSETGKNAGR